MNAHVVAFTDLPATRRITDTYFIILGAFSTLLIFNQVYVGVNFSLIWLGIIGAPLLSKRHPIRPEYIALSAFLLLILLKFFLSSNISSISRYITYILFALCCGASMAEKEFERFFTGFEFGLILNIFLAVVQMAGLLTDTFVATFPVTTWNRTLWHYTLEEGLLKFLPRVPGFTQEPAYLGTLVLAAAGYRRFVQERPVLLGYYGVYLLISVMLLVNSRTVVVGYCWLVMSALSLTLRDRRGMKLVYLMIYALSFIILPIVIIATTDTRDLKFLADQDISIFARAVPLTWIDEKNNLTFVNYLVGVGDYHAYTQSVNMSDLVYNLLEAEGGLLDAKSLGGAYFFDFGFAGLAAYMIVVGYICRNKANSLLFMSLINIAFFNVYALSWPLYWLFLIACGINNRMAADHREARRWAPRTTIGGRLSFVRGGLYPQSHMQDRLEVRRTRKPL